MFDPRTPPKSFTRRGTVLMALAALGGSAAVPYLTAKPAPKPAPKAPTLKRAALKDWPSLTKIAQTMIDDKLTPGLSLTVAHQGVVLFSKGFGLADVEAGREVTPQTTFRIASITKQFTAAAIMALAEDGKLSVHDPLARFLPDFPKADKITLAQLMSHTSGMGDYVNGQSHVVLDNARDRDFNGMELLSIIRARQPLYRAQPGAAWLYSNSAFTLLSIIVEQLSGMSFAQFCAERLFHPAGMTQSSIDTVDTVITSGSNGYRPEFRAPHGFVENKPLSATFIAGAGAIRSTTEDLILWHHALMNGKVLKPDSVTAMMTPALLKNGQPAFERRGAEPLEYGFGLGLGLEDDRRFATHGGRINGFTGHLRSYHDDQLTLAILYNCDGSGAAQFMPMQKKLRKEASRLGLESLTA
ncbi:serine hydrolase [Asticcacaulis sp. SL142]|uniref:serine hydrolase domain-containing protein n=1 Tax=Asticcacaulis sp. SL142 TaxID=2995155 RepID=UPI00226CE3C0|nr:serine hydrolase domain-containing protein [Asticcacaulis sp. SL142]WAC49609.1 serine hydrolase [Asticcacaulis sp. SL142]